MGQLKNTGIFEELRSHYWSNRSYSDYDSLLYAAIDAWQNAALDPEIIKSVCRTPYAQRSKLIQCKYSLAELFFEVFGERVKWDVFLG